MAPGRAGGRGWGRGGAVMGEEEGVVGGSSFDDKRQQLPPSGRFWTNERDETTPIIGADLFDSEGLKERGATGAFGCIMADPATAKKKEISLARQEPGAKGGTLFTRRIYCTLPNRTNKRGRMVLLLQWQAEV